MDRNALFMLDASLGLMQWQRLIDAVDTFAQATSSFSGRRTFVRGKFLIIFLLPNLIILSVPPYHFSELIDRAFDCRECRVGYRDSTPTSLCFGNCGRMVFSLRQIILAVLA